MSINPLKEFFKRRKAEVNFARAGPGKTLSTDSAKGASSSKDQTSARQAAADAAMKRFSKDTNKPAQRPRIVPSTTAGSRPESTSNEPGTGVQSSTSNEPQIQQKELPVVDGVAQRNVQIYTTEELARRVKDPEIDDEFFRLTVEDAKLMQQRHNEERAKNEILKTCEMRRREAEAKKPTTNIARLRFKLPNETVIEASFSGREKLGFVRDWLVATCLDKMNGLELKNFNILFGLKPFKEADFNKNLAELGLLPATTINIVLRNS